jgi:hypothetical protein
MLLSVSGVVNLFFFVNEKNLYNKYKLEHFPTTDVSVDARDLEESSMLYLPPAIRLGNRS